MPRCYGYVIDGELKCPIGKKATHVVMSQGDMMLCKHCEDVRFPDCSRLFLERQRQTSTAAVITGATSRPTPSAPPAEDVVTAGRDQATEPALNTPVNVLRENLVVNELLCFVSNKLDILVHDILVKICADHYDKHSIEYAKKLLHEHCVSANVIDLPRYIIRKGQNKKTADMTDILALFHEMGTHIPTFVASDLSKLPPVSVDYVQYATGHNFYEG